MFEILNGNFLIKCTFSRAESVASLQWLGFYDFFRAKAAAKCSGWSNISHQNVTFYQRMTKHMPFLLHFATVSWDSHLRPQIPQNGPAIHLSTTFVLAVYYVYLRTGMQVSSWFLIFPHKRPGSFRPYKPGTMRWCIGYGIHTVRPSEKQRHQAAHLDRLRWPGLEVGQGLESFVMTGDRM